MVYVLLKFIRIRHNVSIRELSRKAKVSKSEICRIESGIMMPRLDTLFFIAKALNVRVEDLYYVDYTDWKS